MMKLLPFTLSPHILQRTQDVARALGIIAGKRIDEIPLKLRRENSIKTIQASLAIEGNTLTLDQVSTLLEGRPVLGPPRDILEVKNALTVYENLKAFDVLNHRDLLRAHALLMEGLVSDNGQWRTGNVGVFAGKQVAHVAPPAKRVPALMTDLFRFLNQDTSLPWLLKACIFHYELEFIHPFSDGNGRIGRLWQQLLLMKEDPIFEFIPIEVLVKENQQGYYNALGTSDAMGESTPFVEFAIDIIHKALRLHAETTSPIPEDVQARLTYARKKLGADWFPRKVYMQIHTHISSATASRDLIYGTEQGLLLHHGQKNQTLYKFV